MRFGRFELDIFSDGTFKIDGGAMFGVVPKVLWSKHKEPDDLNRVTMDMNCVLIRDADHVLGCACPAVLRAENDARQDAELDERDECMVEMPRHGCGMR